MAPQAAATLEASVAPRRCCLPGLRRAAPFGRPREQSPRLRGVGPDDGRVPRAEQWNLVLEDKGALRLLRRPAPRALGPAGLASLRQRVLAGRTQPVAAWRRRRRPPTRAHRARGGRRDAACNPVRRPVLTLAPHAAVAPATAAAAALGDAARAAHVALAQHRGTARRRRGRPRRTSDAAAHLITRHLVRHYYFCSIREQRFTSLLLDCPRAVTLGRWPLYCEVELVLRYAAFAVYRYAPYR